MMRRPSVTSCSSPPGCPSGIWASGMSPVSYSGTPINADGSEPELCIGRRQDMMAAWCTGWSPGVRQPEIVEKCQRQEGELRDGGVRCAGAGRAPPASSSVSQARSPCLCIWYSILYLCTPHPPLLPAALLFRALYPFTILAIFFACCPLTFQSVERVPFFLDTSHREERPWNDR